MHRGRIYLSLRIFPSNNNNNLSDDDIFLYFLFLVYPPPPLHNTHVEVIITIFSPANSAI
jgi:hypothetical protein